MGKSGHRGFSLIESLMILGTVGLILTPIMASLSQSNRLQRANQVGLSRSLRLDGQVEKMNSHFNTFGSTFNDGSIQTYTQNNATLGIMTKVDNTNSNIFNRQAIIYTYNPGYSGNTDWKDAIPVSTYTNNFFLDVGDATTSTVDGLGNLWLADSNAYDGTNKVGGYNSTYSGSIATTSSDLSNLASTSGTQAVFKDWRTGTDIRYDFPVSNGSYTVDVYMVEDNAAVTGSAPNRRRADIQLEGATVEADVSPFERAGFRKGIIARNNVTVADGVLSLRIINAVSGTNYNAVISGIAIYPKGVTAQ
jgi:hypothetical protein